MTQIFLVFFVHPAGEPVTTYGNEPAPYPRPHCHKAQAVEKAPAARRSEDVSEDSTAAVRQANARSDKCEVLGTLVP